MISECVVCGSKDYSLEEEWRGFRLAKCKHCGVTFTLNPDYRPEAYDAAYKGIEGTPVPEEHSYVYVNPAERLKLEIQAFLVPPPRLTPAERIALAWIERNAPKGTIVIDCGCGSGRFLRALKRRGFRGIGVEISLDLVDMLNRLGLKALLGKAPDFEWNGEPPFAITFFEVLEHIPQPVEVLKALRERFPTTCILASVPSPSRPGLLFKGKLGLSDYPPNHFLRWTPVALEVAFQRAGYNEVKVVIPSPVGSEMLPGLGQLRYKLNLRGISPYENENPGHAKSKRTILGDLYRGGIIQRLGATGILWLLRLYQLSADIVGYPAARNASRKGASASSMLVIAKTSNIGEKYI